MARRRDAGFVLPERVATPALVLDLERLERNLTRMAALAHDLGVALRPHAKTHKCIEIARRQVAAGAHGLSVATVGEAEIFAAAGIDDLFIAYPVWTRGCSQRLHDLRARARLRIGVDSGAGAAALGEALDAPNSRQGVSTARSPFEVLVEVDCGQHRSGVAPESAGDIAISASRAGLDVIGVFSFPGHSYQPGRPERAASDEAEALAVAAHELMARGIEPRVISGGSTPTARYTKAGTINELRPGVYVGNDAQQVELGTCGRDDVAVYAISTVVSTPARDRYVLDAGSKVLGADRPAWMPGHGLVVGSIGRPEVSTVGVISQLSEHHAVVSVDDGEVDEGTPLPAIGQRMAVIPNHVCAAINLADEMVIVAEGTAVGRWPVAARGRNS